MTPDEMAQALTARFQITHNGLPTAIADSIRAALRERDAEWAAALKASHYDYIDGPHVGCRDCDRLRALLEEAGNG